MICTEKLPSSCPFNLTHKLKKTKNVLNKHKMRESEMKVL